MPNPSKPIHVTLLGDSTIDNRIWVRGIIKNVIFTRLGLSDHASWLKPELSVVENLREQLPENYEIHDGTNDGFTSADILNGAMRDKVFGEGTSSLFPHEKFTPLKDKEQEICQADFVVLSVGGNDIREFLQKALWILKKDTHYFKSFVNTEFHPDEAFNPILKELKQNYLAIIQRIREINPHARLILMTQYYPSAVQNNYHIYPLMKQIGEARRGLITDSHPDPMDVIHDLVTKTYRSILGEINDQNIVVADITSSLNPFDPKNHTAQIEPSGQGGKKISQMLQHLITQSVPAGQIYRFEPSFFSETPDDHCVIATPIDQTWQPLHPQQIKAAEESHKATSKPDKINYSFLLDAVIAIGTLIAGATALALGVFLCCTGLVSIGIVVASLGSAIGAYGTYQAHCLFGKREPKTAKATNQPVASIVCEATATDPALNCWTPC